MPFGGDADGDSVVLPAILSGGAGTRLWPLSRNGRPKQLLELDSSESLLVRTLRRTAGNDLFAPPLVICADDHRFIVAEQLRVASLRPRSIVLEPVGRNTAPAAAVACLLLMKENPDAVVMVLPSDHVVRDADRFHAAVRTGLVAARQGALVTFGVVPERPDVGFGYVRRGDPVSDVSGAYWVGHFVEKPPAHDAEKYAKADDYYWNSGMFLFRADCFLEELELWRPDVVSACRDSVAKAERDLEFVRLPVDSFCAAPDVSVDKAVMESTRNAVVVPTDFGWSDIGSWSALWESGDKCEDGNVMVGEVYAEDTKRSYIHSDHQTVATLGLRDMVVVATEGSVLVTPMDRAQELKSVVDRLKARRSNEFRTRDEVFRPWGSYKSIEAGENFQVKRLRVNPGLRLSSQLHSQRGEHWVVVRGRAKVTIADRTFLLHENEAAYVPQGTEHRLENASDEALILIEVQYGGYLGEDDIVRLEDDYGAATGGTR